MYAFLSRRLATIAPTLLFVTMLIRAAAIAARRSGGRPRGRGPRPECRRYLRAKMHLDEPLPVRYVYWLGGVLRGDLGESLRMQKPVTALIIEKLP